MKSGTSIKGVILLFITAIVWGASFVSQSVGSKCVGPFTFMAVRTLLGSFVLIPVILVIDRHKRLNLSEDIVNSLKIRDRRSYVYGSLTGIPLCLATNIQQHAFIYSEAGKIAFITSMYILFVPVASFFMGKKLHKLTWLCVILGIFSLYLISFKGVGSSVNKGDILALLCAFVFTLQIIMIDRYGEGCDAIKFSCAEFFVSGLISLVFMFILETPTLDSIRKASLPILYAGIMSCGVGYTLQTVGQAYAESHIASLIMASESVFALIFSSLLLSERLSMKEAFGCILMLFAIVLSNVIQTKKE